MKGKQRRGGEGDYKNDLSMDGKRANGTGNSHYILFYLIVALVSPFRAESKGNYYLLYFFFNLVRFSSLFILFYIPLPGFY